MTIAPRLVPLVGHGNMRDLGGYATVDGRWTRCGKLYRHGLIELQEASDLEYLAMLGLSETLDLRAVSYTHLRAHETPEHLVCRLLLEKKKNYIPQDCKREDYLTPNNN
eukprot:TRINITY_DN27106_c0_g1_i1.p1 TRINITY_DN27106_c0_g1~~TRINITY_DN27106_c0_g1_i1.p1  ORF type:complete len:109 (+),score=21.45 TRINITY_DN27106_c0_g1_i1:200-526(+)